MRFVIALSSQGCVYVVSIDAYFFAVLLVNFDLDNG